MPTAGKSKSASHAPPPTNPAVSALTSHAPAVTHKTAIQAKRQGRNNPPRRRVCASITSGETQATKSRIWLRSSIARRAADHSALDVEGWTFDVPLTMTSGFKSELEG